MAGEILRVWVDAQLPPALARWLDAQPGVEASHVQVEGLLDATDRAIFEAARRVGAVVLTKDVDFVQLLERYGPPPRIVWLTCGNITNRDLLRLMETAWPRCIELLAAGEVLIEIRGPESAI